MGDKEFLNLVTHEDLLCEERNLGHRIKVFLKSCYCTFFKNEGNLNNRPTNIHLATPRITEVCRVHLT